MKRVLGNLVRATGITSNSQSTSGVFHGSEILDLREKYELAGINRNVKFLESKGGIQDWIDLRDDASTFNLNADGSMKIKPDGTRIWIGSTTGLGSLVQFELSEAWNPKSITSPTLFYLYPETNFRAFCFSSDGTYLYTHGTTVDDLVQWELDTPWDIGGTVTEVNRLTDWSTTGVTSLHINNDGTRLFAMFSIGKNVANGYENYPILQFNLSTPYDITSMTASSAANQWQTLYDETMTTDYGIKYHFAFIEDQKKIFISSDYDSSETVQEFRLSNAYSISTATLYANTTVSVPDPHLYSSNKHALQFGANGQYLYNITDGTSINRFEMDTPYDPSTINANTINVEGSLLFSNFGAYAGLEWKPDGTSVIIHSNLNVQNNADVFRYDLGTAWDVTTAKFSGKVFNTYPFTQYQSNDMRIGDSGTKMYVIQDYEDSIGQFTLQTAWDPSTATFDGFFTLTLDYETAPRCMAWKPDGTKFYLYGTTGDNITEFDVTTPWDLTGTVTYSGESGAINNNLFSIDWNGDGTQIAGATTSSDLLYYYSVGTAYDITTLNTSGSNISITTLDNNPYTFRWMNSGTMVTVSGTQYDPDIVTATVGTAYDPTTIDLDTNNKKISDVADNHVGFYVSPDGHFLAFNTTVDDRVISYTTSSNGVFNTTTVNGVEHLDVSGSIATQWNSGIFFKPDGTKMYLMEYAEDLKQYSLSTAWDITSATYDSVVYDMDGQGADTDATHGIWFRDDGLKLFSVGLDNKIKSHTLTTAWDLSTASVDTAEINLIDLNWAGIYLSDDGTRVYVSGYDWGYVHQYNLDTAWDLDSFNNTGGALYIGPHRPHLCGGFSFSSDGSKLYFMVTRRGIGGYSTYDSNRVITIELDTAWEINTANFLKNVSTSYYPHLLGKDVHDALEVDDVGKIHVLDVGTSSLPTITVFNDKKRGYWDGPEGYDIIGLANYTQEEWIRWEKSVTFDHWMYDSQGFCYGDSGTKLYMLDTYLGYIHQFNLSTAYDPLTATHSNKMFVFDGNNIQTTSYNRHAWYDVKWSHDGTYCFILDNYEDIIWQLQASTAWDVSSLVYNSFYSDNQGDAIAIVNGYLDVTAQETDPRGFAFNHDGSLLYVVGRTGDDLNTYVLKTNDIVGEPYLIGCADPAGNGTNNKFANSMPFEFNELDPIKIVPSKDFTSYYILTGSGNFVYQVGPINKTDGIQFTGSGNNYVQIVDFAEDTTVSGEDGHEFPWALGGRTATTGLRSISNGLYNRLVHISKDMKYFGTFFPNQNYGYGGGAISALPSADSDGSTSVIDRINSIANLLLSFPGDSAAYDRRVPTCMFFAGSVDGDTYRWYAPTGKDNGTQTTTTQWWQNNNNNQMQQGTIIGNYGYSYDVATDNVIFPDEITGVTFSRDGLNLFVAFLNGVIAQWNVPTAWDITSMTSPGLTFSTSGAYAAYDTAYGTDANDGLGDIEISDDGTTLFALNHYDTGSVIEVFNLTTPNDLKTLKKTGKLITPPHTNDAAGNVTDTTSRRLCNSLCFREGFLIFVPYEAWDGSEWQPDIFVVDFNQPIVISKESNLPATLMNANSIPATTLITQGNTYTYSLWVDDPEGETGTWSYEIVSGNGTIGTNADANFANVVNVGNGTFTITGTTNSSFLVTQSANIVFSVDIGEILTASTLLRGYDYPASITGSSVGANTNLISDKTYTYNFTVSDPEGETGTNWQYTILDGNITVGTDPNSNFFVSANNVGNGTFIFTTTSNAEVLVANSTNSFQSSNISFTVDLTNETVTLGPSTVKGIGGTAGGLYATQYVSLTGGSVVQYNIAGSIDSQIDALSDGDALLLAPGTYSATRGSTGVDVFRNKQILICGDTEAAGDIVIEFDHDLPSGVRDHPIFDNTNTDLKAQLAFISLKRIQTDGTNYISALVKGNGRPSKGKAVNCYFDFNTSDVSWIYDNNSLTTIDVRFHNCTFANYTNWDSKYSGRADVVDVHNALFDDTYDTNDTLFYGTTVGSATVDTVNRTYNTGTYPNSGHLIIDDNYLDHANTA